MELPAELRAVAQVSSSAHAPSSGSDDSECCALFFSNCTCLGMKARGRVQSLVSDQTNANPIGFGLIETHIGENLRTKWAKQFRSQKLKHEYDLARSTGHGSTEAKRDRANEGGDVLLFRQHLQVHRFPFAAGDVPDLCAEGHGSFDGLLPVIVHF